MKTTGLEIGSEIIKNTQVDNLVISEDIGLEGEPIAVLLFTPDMADTRNHHHISMSVADVERLSAWTVRFLAIKPMTRLRPTT